ncbi:hypothetical protein LP420_10835 [Massilia sp. B-10]|nr:hypothetical protein LP420_10835 [Massilia sp. B-10]
MYTCRSFDIVAHETAHAVLDGLKPAWLLADNPPQTGALHEAFGDLTAIFLTLSQLDQCEAIVAQTRARLHDKTFLADIAEQFGLALGRSNGLRNADNDITLAQAGAEVHAISQVFTGAIYDILADLFALERDPARRDDALVLHQVGATLRGAGAARADRRARPRGPVRGRGQRHAAPGGGRRLAGRHPQRDPQPLRAARRGAGA